MEWKGGGGGGDGYSGTAQDPNEILVFGYACKLFRDDEKADWIEKEKHLIPWMGDGSGSTTIDRYDGRGALMDLGSAGMPQDNTDILEGLYMSEAELERVLQEERYRDLREESDFDDNDYQELEFKRFQCDVNDSMSDRTKSYAAIGYSYEQPVATQEEESQPDAAKADDDRPYSKPLGLVIPDHIVPPPTMKLHSIIEKTAKFIASQGNQMEIILKTKQSGNPLFNFLEYKDDLNPYFKFLVQVIRENKYSPQEFEAPPPPPRPEPKQSSDHGDSSEDDEGYLHPSLFRSSVITESPVPSPSFNYKANTGNSAYSLLVSKIRGTTHTDQQTTAAPPPQGLQSNSMSGDSCNGTGGFSQGNSGQPHFIGHGGENLLNVGFHDSNAAHSRPPNQIPPPADQVVIEKMANYVVKNGPAFEDLAKTKGDLRFVFLNPSHEFHWYYLNCKERFRAECSAVVANQQFLSYNSPHPEQSRSPAPPLPEPVPKKIVLKSIELPLSESGIPIANVESISNRPTSIPPEVASRIEEIKRKKALLAAAKKEPSPPKIQFSSSIAKGINLRMETNTADVQGKASTSSEESTLDSISGRDSSLNSNPTRDPVPEKPEDEAERRKQLRRQKATLFLQRLNVKPNNSDTVNNNVEEEHPSSDCTIIPPESVVDDDIVFLDERNGPSSKDERLRSPSNGKNGRHRSQRRSYSKSHSRSRSPSASYRRSRSSSSSRSSHSDSSSKKKKKKSSKKRKKKHGRDRSRSSSRTRKKSKKHRQR